MRRCSFRLLLLLFHKSERVHVRVVSHKPQAHGIVGEFAHIVAVVPTDDPPDFVVTSNFMRGLAPNGQLFDFAQNIVGDGEFTGATFSPRGNRLFFNIQTTSSDVGYGTRGPGSSSIWIRGLAGERA